MKTSELRRSFRLFDGTCFCATLSALAYFLALVPSLNTPWLIWIVPAFWAVMIRQRLPSKALSENGASPSPSESPAALSRTCRVVAWGMFYLKICLAAIAGWLLPLLWLRFDTPWANGLWVVLSVCLGLSWGLFVGLSRTGVHRMGVPVIVMAPVVWCGLEWLRKNYLLGGISVGSLEHALYGNTTFIQIADIFGEYGVGMLIVFVGACIGRLSPISDDDHRLQRPLVRFLDSKGLAGVSCVLLLTVVSVYGSWRLRSLGARNRKDGVSSEATIALLQTNIDSPDGITTEMAEERVSQLRELSHQRPLGFDLVVWPEAILPWHLHSFPSGFVPEGWETQPEDAVEQMLRKARRENHEPLIGLAKQAQTPMLLGTIASDYEQGSNGVVIHTMNSAVLVDPKNGIGPRYDKINLAPFGECNPLAQWIPERYGFRSRLTAGTMIPAFRIRSHGNTPGESSKEDAGEGRLPSPLPLLATVNICFDSTFPHFIRRQVRTLTERGEVPDVLINLSSDALFDHTFIVEMHLATHVFRAIENRKPYLAATNCGYSVWIDNTGRIVDKGEKRATMYVAATIARESTTSLYLYWGDWLPVCCACFNGLVIVWWSYRKLVPEQPITNHANGKCRRIA